MKKITLLCIAFIAFAFSFQAKAQCTWTIELTDDWGDGWNGVSNIDVFVDGVEVLTDIGVADPPGDTQSFTFTVNPGDDVTTAFNPAATAGFPDYAAECSYRILDNNGVEVYSSGLGTDPVHNGPADVLTGTITATCAVCTAPTVDTGSLLLVSSDCGAGTFDFSIDVTDLGGAASITVTNDAGVPSETVMATGVYTFSGYPTDTAFSLTFVDDEDPACDVVVGPIIFVCPPANDECATATSIVQETSIPDAASATPTAGILEGATDSGLAAEECNGFTGTANDDVWFSFEALTTDVTITCEVVGFDAVVQLYSGACGSLTNIGCADDTVVTAPIVEEINATGLTPGNTYYVRLYQYGTGSTVGDTYDIKIWSSLSLSNTEFENETDFTYYPNPVNNKLTLNAVNNIQNVAVYNMLGQEVMRATPNSVEGELDMSSLQTGAYFVKVTVNDVTQTVRILKQ